MASETFTITIIITISRSEGYGNNTNEKLKWIRNFTTEKRENKEKFETEILLDNDLWNNVNLQSSDPSLKNAMNNGDKVARTFYRDRLNDIMLSFGIKISKLTRKKEVDVVSKREIVFTRLSRDMEHLQRLLWSTTEGENFYTLWSNAEDDSKRIDLCQRLGITRESISGGPYLLVFNYKFIDKWRKPNCFDGIQYKHFVLNTDNKKLVGKTKSLSNNESESDGFDEIVHTLKRDSCKIKLLQDEDCKCLMIMPNLQ